MSCSVNTIVLMNIEKVCRICLMENEDMQSIYSKLEEREVLEVNVLSLSEALTRITNLMVSPNDGFPSLICSSCIVLVYNAYKFKVQFDQSYSILQQYVSECIKDEIPPLHYIENSTYNSDCDVNVADNFINSISKSQNDQFGKRRTSKQQIEKRKIETTEKRMKKRGRKRKVKRDIETDEPRAKTDLKTILHPCPICTEQFTALDLRKHAHTHKALKKYLSIPEDRLVGNGSRFYKETDPNKKLIGFHGLEEKLHKCVHCDVQCTASVLRFHLLKHRNQNDFKCDQCQRVFKKLNHLNTHRVKHLKECPFKCAQCGKGFVIETNYNCHMLTHNSNEELPHECKYCLKRFSNPEHLNRHIIMHTENVSYSVKYKVCKCYHCLKTFKDKGELTAHTCVPIEQVTNTRYPCKVCNKVFKNASGLYSHNRNIHKLKGAKILCSVCGHYVANIYNHMMRHTGEKPYQCSQCGKRFVGKPQLRQHLLVHSGLKPYVCSVCAKAFNNLYNLQVHERIHRGDRCHVCPICNKGFLEKSYLKKHMNIHSRL